LPGRELLRAITLEAQCPSLAGGLQGRSDNRYPATANGLTNAGGTATEVHSLAETQKLGSTEFPRRTITPVVASRKTDDESPHRSLK
jgi:hypothetical protein